MNDETSAPIEGASAAEALMAATSTETSLVTSLLPQIADETLTAAIHGSFCPKMCTFACPVTIATGRDDAVPWSLHRTVSDLATGRLEPDSHAAQRLEACTGCHACQDACTFEQDVPAQVREARAAVVAAGAGSPVVALAADLAADGRSPHGAELVDASDGTTATTIIMAGCRDDADMLSAVHTLISAAGQTARIVAPPGCCGGALDDLGDTAAAAARRDATAGLLAGAELIVSTDPHCLPSLRAIAGDATVVDAVSHVAGLLDAGSLELSAGAALTVTYHDPCLLARDEGVVDAPRELLRAVGATILEPEGSGRHTVCSGAGMAMELLAPGSAAETARRRGELLTQPEADVIVTACGGARRRLGTVGASVDDLFVLLAANLHTEPSASSAPNGGASA